MRIGISCYPTWGGSGVVATELAMALAAGGDEVHVISYAMPSRLELVDLAEPLWLFDRRSRLRSMRCVNRLRSVNGSWPLNLHHNTPRGWFE